MTLPSIDVTQRDTPPPRSNPTNTGVGFMVGTTDRGPQEAVPISSLAQFVSVFGDRQSYSILYDAVETAFRDGCGLIYIGRVLGPAAAKATVNLYDQAGSTAPGDVSLVATAKSKGAWANSLNVTITVTGTDFQVIVTDDVLGTLETSPLLADRTAALTWAENSDNLDLALGASNEDPRAVAASSLASGADDRGSIVDASWQAALDLFTRDLGPGQLAAPARSTLAGQLQLLAHARANGRAALLDGPDSASPATWLASADALRDTADDRYGAMFGPWVDVPGLTPGTTRAVPYSAVQMGLCARSDGLGNSPNVPAAGQNGESRFALNVRATWTDAEREQLNDGGVNVARFLYGAVRTYGYRSLVDPLTDKNWVPFNNVRLFMGVKAKAYAVAEQFMFDQIDGRGKKLAEFNGQLVGDVLLPYYEAGSLFGETPDEAFNVETGPQVNTPQTLADNKLKAVIAVRMSPFAEMVLIEIVKVRTEEAVA